MDTLFIDPIAEAVPSLAEAGFVLLSEVIPDAIFDIRYYSDFNFVGARIDSYEAPLAFLTGEAASALKKASDSLMEQGYRMKIYDAYRPQTAVDHFVRWAKDPNDVKMKSFFYPQVDKTEILPAGFIAERSSHSRGSTVDLTIVDLTTGQEVDMGSVFDFFGEISHAEQTEGLTETQIENRRILHRAMSENGFRVLPQEWWHFTLEKEPYPDTYFDFRIRNTVKNEHR